MDERICHLAKVAAASLRGEEIDAQWLYDESLSLLEKRDSYQTNALWHTLVDAGRALNDVGEYALGGEVFEQLVAQARARCYPKIEFDGLEGLAESWFYMGDHDRALQYLNLGLELASRLKRKHAIERFEDAIEHYRRSKGKCTEAAKAPADARSIRKSRKAHVSSLLKKERNRF